MTRTQQRELDRVLDLLDGHRGSGACSRCARDPLADARCITRAEFTRCPGRASDRRIDFGPTKNDACAIALDDGSRRLADRLFRPRPHRLAPRRPPSEYPWLAFALTHQSFWCRYSLTDAATNVSGKVIANYWLSHVYAPEIDHAHRNADIHIHDLDMLAGYCAGWSLRQLLHEGLNGVPGKVEAGPPKHMSSAVGQIVNFLGTLQNEWAGPQAFSSFDTYMAPYIRKDRMRYGDVKQCIQELIYNLNVPSRWGTQTPFTNLTFDWVCPEDLRGQIPIIGGEEMYFCYGDLQPEMDAINRAYIETMTAGCFSTAPAPSGA
jgi:Anaerobic ribonucleoside-triphosphate reductase